MDIKHKDGDVYMSQNNYIEAKIDYLSVEIPKNSLDMELSQENKKILWDSIGRFRWLCD